MPSNITPDQQPTDTVDRHNITIDITTNDAVTASILRDRLMQAVSNLGSEASVEFCHTRHIVSRFNNDDF
tara:strand:- start:9438 stop:9647 length:210 start_codon:yes stop_codon:yes gene_type:complete